MTVACPVIMVMFSFKGVVAAAAVAVAEVVSTFYKFHSTPQSFFRSLVHLLAPRACNSKFVENEMGS